ARPLGRDPHDPGLARERLLRGDDPDGARARVPRDRLLHRAPLRLRDGSGDVSAVRERGSPRDLMAESLFADAELPERHRAVLREALLLFAEKGYAGASLRELARRVGVRQPSLYHYFRSKDELVEQILTHVGRDLFAGAPVLPPGARLADVPGVITRV